jgi:hypothetical protein
VLPGMKQLKKLQIENKKLSPTRYTPLNEDGDESYNLKLGKEEELDAFSLKFALKDYLDCDPSTRFQMAKNFFERALNDAYVFFIFIFLTYLFLLLLLIIIIIIVNNNNNNINN